MRARLLTLSLLLTLVTAVQGQTSADSVALVVDACNKALEERDRGNVGAAASLLEDVWPIVEALPAGTEDVVCHYFSALSCMYAEWGDYNGALKIELELTEYTRRRWGTKSEEWAIRLLNLAESYATTGDNAQAIKCSTEARKLLRKLHGEYHPLYYTATKKHANYLMESNPRKGLALLEEALALADTIFTHGSQESAMCRIEIASFHLTTTLDEQYLLPLVEGLITLDSLGLNSSTYYFTYLALLQSCATYFNNAELLSLTNERLLLLLRLYVHDNFAHLPAQQRASLWDIIERSIHSIPGAAMITLARDTPDPATIVSLNRTAYDAMLFYKGLLLNTDVTLRQGGELIDFLYTDHTDVSAALQVGEAAVEFFSFDNEEVYGALVLLGDTRQQLPYVLTLCNAEQLNGNLYDAVWKPLETVLRNVTKVHFACDGRLHTLPLEAATDGSGTLASERWQLRRLSSTRELTKPRPKPKQQKAVLYGGLNYNTTATADSTRYGVGPLPGTLLEVQSIGQALTEVGIEHTTLTADHGTEESLRTLPAGITLLHFATHGFSWNDSLAERRAQISFLASRRPTERAADRAMQQSGLMMSGANHGLAADERTPTESDGVLTAEELATLNLKGVDLIVLSACQSALGEATGEGVFGLQRGFKLAGARALLMTLWNVADRPTAILMQHFYAHLLAGHTASQSLQLAQQHLRQQPRYADPHYWAAFVLVDAD